MLQKPFKDRFLTAPIDAAGYVDMREQPLLHPVSRPEDVNMPPMFNRQGGVISYNDAQEDRLIRDCRLVIKEGAD